MDKSYGRALLRLRALRLAAGLTLRQVEIKSRNRWKAVVVGSYERGTRNLSLKSAIELCDFYGADVADLGFAKTGVDNPEIIFDLRKVARVRDLPDDFGRTIARLTARIANRRGDYNGEVLSTRRSDLETLEILLDMNQSEIIAPLKLRELLISK